ncbi:hypothetical protein JCM8547_006402 [Rhodosporidiobolus lusitaniae]
MKRDGDETVPLDAVKAALSPILTPLGLQSVGDALTDSDISVSATDDQTGLATAEITGAGILKGVEIKVPVLQGAPGLTGSGLLPGLKN